MEMAIFHQVPDEFGVVSAAGFSDWISVTGADNRFHNNIGRFVDDEILRTGHDQESKSKNDDASV